MKKLLLIVLLAAMTARAEINVPLQLDVPAPIDAGTWPTWFGVPFPDGALSPDAKLTVLADGKPIATQTAPLATWDQGGQSVRWLLVDCQIDAGAPPKSMQLIEAATPTTGLKHGRDGDAMVINTGAATFRVNAKAPLSVVCEPVVSRAEPMTFTIEDQDGKTFVADGSQGLTIEDDGPLRLTVRSEGWFRASDGKTFCQHITRLHFFAGRSTVRVVHTFIMTETGEHHRLRDIAVNIPVGGSRATFGIDSEDLAKTHTTNNNAYLTQDCEDRWHLSWQLHDGGAIAAKGEKYGGWANLSGKRGGVTAAIREAWQNYPNEIESRDGSLIAHLWPRHGREMDFRTRPMLATYGEDGVAAIDRFFLAQKKPYTKSIDDIDNNAMGVGKTYELWLDFHQEAFEAERAIRVAHQANTPVLVTSTGAWNCASGAMIAPMHPYDPQQFPRVEAMIDAAFDKFLIWQEHFSDFGWADYGDVHCGARRNDFGMKLEGGQMATPWRYWDSTHYGLPNSPWMLYLRSGNRKYLQFAEANARHCMDIDRCHFGDGDVRLKGTHYYCDWSIIHWNGLPPTYVWLTTYDKLEYLSYAYTMRGDRRALEVFKAYGEAVALYHDDTSKQFPLRMLRPNYKNARHFGPPLSNMSELYQLTWDERYLNIARDYAKAFIEMYPDGETFNHYLGKMPYCWEGLARYGRLTDDPTFLEYLKKYTVGAAHRGGMRNSYGSFAYGYAFTQDAALLDLGKATLMQQLASVDVSDRFDYRGDGGSWVCGDHPFMLRSLPVFLGAMTSAPQAWRNANLPLLETNNTLHFAGPRHPTVYIKREGKAQPRVALQMFQQQALSINGGALIEASADRYMEIDPQTLTADTNTLMFPVRPTRNSGDYIDRGNINIVAADNVRYVIGPSAEGGVFCVFSPRLYFQVPTGVEQFTVTVQISDTWAAYAWAPIVHLYDADGNIVATQTGPGTLTFTATASAAQQNRCWSIGPIARVSAPKETATWSKPPYPFDKHFPSYLTLSENLPQFIAVRPEHFFIPDTK